MSQTTSIGPVSSTVANRLGLLTIGRKRPGFDQQWNLTMRRQGLEALQALGFECIGAETAVVDDQTTKAAIDKLRQVGCSALLVLQPSMGNGQLSLTVAQSWDAPIVLWATPERQDTPIVSSCSLVAQHLWGSILRRSDHPFELVYGDPGDQRTRRELTRAIALCRAASAIRQSKVGLVGANAPGFLSMAADGFELKQRLGVQLQSLSLPQFIDRVRAIPEPLVAADVAQVSALNLPMNSVTVDDLATNSRYYLAMLELIAEEQLDALAMQCWPEFANVLGQWPYLAFSRLCDAGYPLALEGDVDGAITSHLAIRLGMGTGFITDWLEHDERTIHFWHPGNAPLRMCNPIGSPEGPSLAKHFNITKPLVVDGPLRTDQPVTIARLWRCDGQYHMTAFEGRTIPLRRKLTGNTALVEVPDRNVRDWFDEACHAGLPHHVTLFPGEHAEMLRRLARMLKITWLA